MTPLYQTLLADPKFHERILDFDRDRAEACRATGCPDCGGTLHAANYLRKPRGWLIALGEEHNLRFSFCCAVDGCRDRATPPSLRFLGRKVYLATIVILISAMRNGLTERRLGKLAEAISVDRRTVARWRTWWLATFTPTPFWQARQTRFWQASAHAGLSCAQRWAASPSPHTSQIIDLSTRPVVKRRAAGCIVVSVGFTAIPPQSRKTSTS